MRFREIGGWTEAVARARELWPSIPSTAYDRLGEEEAPAATYYEASWFSLHPRVVGEAAARIAGVVFPGR